MPKQWIFEDFVPRSDTRHRRIDQHKFGNLFRVLRGKGESHHIADVMRYQFDLLYVQCPKDIFHINGLRFLLISGCRMRGQAHSSQIRHNDRVILHHGGGKRLPHVACLAITVQHQNSRPAAAHAHVYRCPLNRNLSGLEAGRKRLDLRSRDLNCCKQRRRAGGHPLQHRFRPHLCIDRCIETHPDLPVKSLYKDGI